MGPVVEDGGGGDKRARRECTVRIPEPERQEARSPGIAYKAQRMGLLGGLPRELGHMPWDLPVVFSETSGRSVGL